MSKKKKSTDRLLIQSIGSNPDDRFLPYMKLQEPVHRDYAERCGADYRFFVGESDPLCNPTWNRIEMMLTAFDEGYRKIVWLDADTLVVAPDENIFADTSDAPLLMTRVLHSHVEIPWGPFDGDLRRAGYCGSEHPETLATPRFCRVPIDRSLPTMGHVGKHGDSDGPWEQWDCYNDGVLIVNESPHARAALEFAWENRLATFRPWHVPGMPELDWLLDYVFDYPESVEQLDDRWNWMGYPHACPRDEAVILAWHGMPGVERWKKFEAAWRENYGA